MKCGIDHSHGSDLALLWLRPAAIAPIRPLAWDPPCATGVALIKKKKVIDLGTERENISKMSPVPD